MSSPDRAHPRLPLTRERIVDAAVAIVDAAGPDALTMRSVATALDAGAMSLYRHVGGRDELLDLVLERIASDLPVTPPIGEWRADLEAIARDVRAGLLRRPHLTVLLTSRTGRGAAGLPHLERTLAVLRDAGFDARDAAYANHALGNLVAGAALWEAVGFGGAQDEARRAIAAEGGASIHDLPETAFPAIRWAAPALFAGSADDRFEFGIRLLLDGLAGRPRAGHAHGHPPAPDGPR